MKPDGGLENAAGRSAIVLAALCAGGCAARFNSIQVQYLLFLIDQEIPGRVGGPHFDFQPAEGGPFDPAVHQVIEALAAAGRAATDSAGPYWTCIASETGYREGMDHLAEMPRAARQYVSRAARWVLSQPFWAMVSGIFRQYPEMAVNSQIPPSALRDPGWQRTMHPFLAGVVSLVGIFRGRGWRRSAHPDAVPLESDWRAVGDDIRLAIQHVHAPGMR